MRVAVLGATGRIGRYTVDTLNGSGHQTVPISRSTGVDAYVGAGLDEALAGVDVVVDVCNTRSGDEAARGEQVRLVPTWLGRFDTSMAGEVMLPGKGARLGTITFDDWLAAGAR